MAPVRVSSSAWSPPQVTQLDLDRCMINSLYEAHTIPSLLLRSYSTEVILEPLMSWSSHPALPIFGSKTEFYETIFSCSFNVYFLGSLESSKSDRSYTSMWEKEMSFLTSHVGKMSHLTYLTVSSKPCTRRCIAHFSAQAEHLMCKTKLGFRRYLQIYSARRHPSSSNKVNDRKFQTKCQEENDFLS